MKKLLTVALAAALVVSMTVPAMAMHFEMNGQLRARVWYLDNYWPNDEGAQKGDMEFVDQRFRTAMTWGLTEQVFLKARADINEGLWGASKGQTTEVTEADPILGIPVTVTRFENLDTKEQISFDQMYGQVVFPGAPVTMTVGRQPVTWGIGMAAKADNRDRLKFAFNAGAATIILAYDKNIESFEQELEGGPSDSRGYVGGVVGNFGGWKTGLLYALGKDQAAQEQTITPDALPIVKDNTTHLLDIFAQGQAGPVAIKAEFAWVTGETKLQGVENEQQRDLDGLGLYLGGFVNAGMANIGLEFGWAKGDDPDTDKNEGAFRMDYHTPYNSVILFNGMDYQGYDNLSRGLTSGDTGLQNAMSVKGTVTASPSEKLSLTGAVLWAKKDQVADGMDDDMGVEADVIASYNLYDNVAFTAGLGYLWVGDYYDADADNALGIMGMTEIKF